VPRTCAHHCSFHFEESVLSSVFDPIVCELNKRVDGEGSGSMFRHSICDTPLHTTARFFETTSFLTDEMNSQLNDWLKLSPNYDGRERKCIRALANHYETTSRRRSTDCKPLMKPHRDNVNDADISFVLGITPTSDYCGAMLYVSKERDGKIWYNKVGSESSPSRKGVIGVDVSKGVGVILLNNVEHYVSALQNGRRGSLVFHMSPN